MLVLTQILNGALQQCNSTTQHNKIAGTKNDASRKTTI